MDDSTNEAEFAQGASTLTEVLDAADRQGHRGEFRIDGDGPQATLTCPHCGASSAPEEIDRLWAVRLEGASDPDDNLSVSAIRCPACSSTGVLIMNFGPEIGEADAAILPRLPNPSHPDDAPDR